METTDSAAREPVDGAGTRVPGQGAPEAPAEGTSTEEDEATEGETPAGESETETVSEEAETETSEESAETVDPSAAEA